MRRVPRRSRNAGHDCRAAGNGPKANSVRYSQPPASRTDARFPLRPRCAYSKRGHGGGNQARGRAARYRSTVAPGAAGNPAFRGGAGPARPGDQRDWGAHRAATANWPWGGLFRMAAGRRQRINDGRLEERNRMPFAGVLPNLFILAPWPAFFVLCPATSVPRPGTPPARPCVRGQV